MVGVVGHYAGSAHQGPTGCKVEVGTNCKPRVGVTMCNVVGDSWHTQELRASSQTERLHTRRHGSDACCMQENGLYVQLA
jgi:hypothetical protein